MPQDKQAGHPEELVTLADFIRWGASRFAAMGLHFGHGTDNAVDEALWLALHALHLEQPLPEALFQARLTAAEKQAVAALFDERIDSRRPAAYLTGEARFAGLPFHVNEHVLIPRSPIAELIDEGFEPWLAVGGIARVLDLCTGSGCIAIACALAFPDAEVHATELSPEALVVARRNAQRHRVEDRLHFHEGDLFAGAPADGGFDLIISNPPYVPPEEVAALPPEFHCEPAMGLAAEEAGTAFAARIITGAADYLSADGLLVIEVGNAAAALADRFPELPMEWPAFERGGMGVCVIHAADLGVLPAPGGK
jgi:ribosomal protein L3 glutamine methyltransferase